MPDLTILPNGDAEGVYSDDAKEIYEALGDYTVERASHVEPAGRQWGVWTRSGKDTGKRFDTRAEALAWEVANINICLEREPLPVPAAACPRCGGWTAYGGMAQYAKSTEPVHGRTGCTCNLPPETKP